MANVSIRGLTKKFAEVAAVDDFHLEIGDGEFVSLLGPSGCGKTTTLRLLAGFLQPDGGEIRAAGEVISSPAHLVPPERRQMSMIFQSYAVWPHMTVAQNVAYGLKFKKLTKQEIEKKVTKLLGVVHLAELKDRYSAELSGGQQQRVALARALVVEPQILLMDEPLSNLDANLREEMRFEIRRLHEEFKITTVYVTHDQAEAMATSDRIAVLDRGRLVQVGRSLPKAAQYFAGFRRRRSAPPGGTKLQSLPGCHSALDLLRRFGRLYDATAVVGSVARHRAADPTVRTRSTDYRRRPSRRVRHRPRRMMREVLTG